MLGLPRPGGGSGNGDEPSLYLRKKHFNIRQATPIAFDDFSLTSKINLISIQSAVTAKRNGLKSSKIYMIESKCNNSNNRTKFQWQVIPPSILCRSCVDPD